MELLDEPVVAHGDAPLRRRRRRHEAVALALKHDMDLDAGERPLVHQLPVAQHLERGSKAAVRLAMGVLRVVHAHRGSIRSTALVCTLGGALGLAGVFAYAGYAGLLGDVREELYFVAMILGVLSLAFLVGGLFKGKRRRHD